MRTIVHLDADAFFASVEQAADPRLRGKPVAVGGEKRGVIASASYEARRLGIYTPMPTARARKLCPRLIVLPGDFDKYEHFSRWMFSYAQDFTPDVEITSIDEGYFDLSAVPKPPVPVAETIRDAIRQALKIQVSEGIGTNKLVSQIASKLNKPAAFKVVPAGGEISFLHPLPNRWLPGVGPQTGQRLDAAGLACIRHVASLPLDLLHLLVGRQAPQLRALANGMDERPVVPLSAPAKSYSHQETFAADLTDEEYAEAVLRHMADDLMATVRAEGRSIRTLTVKVRYNDLAEDQCAESLAEPTDLETDLYGRIHLLFRAAWKRRVSLRMVSLKLANVYDGPWSAELPLANGAPARAARQRLAAAVDALRRDHGQGAILRGHDFRLRAPAHDSAAATQPPATPAPLRPGHLPRRPEGWVPLNVHSHYSFLDSTLSIPAILELARQQEAPAVALTDAGNLHGAVEFCLRADAAGLKPIVGAEIEIEGQPAWLYVENATGYASLCRLLSRERTQPDTAAADTEAAVRRVALRHAQLDGLTDGLIAASAVTGLAEFFPGRFYRAVTDGDDTPTTEPAVWLPAVRYAEPADRIKFDIVQSIRTRTLLRQAHPAKRLTGDFHFRAPAEARDFFRSRPRLPAWARELADRCTFQLRAAPPQFPAFAAPDGLTPAAFLRQLVLAGAQWRYRERAARIRPQIEEELGIIAEVGYAEYFLVVWDLLQACRQRGIEWITRGSAADSLVCYCLGISGVCPLRFDLYFRRFLNRERMRLNKLPDIDVDFAHDRKDDVVDLIFAKYGAAHTAVVGGFSTFQARSAVADVAKVLGVSEYQVRRFTEHFPWTSAGDLTAALAQNPECHDLPVQEEPYRTALQMAACLDGVPRYAKMHPCGVVLSRQPMHALTPTFMSGTGRPTTHFDMDSVEAIGLVKMDILAQGGLAAMRDAKASLARRGVTVDLESLEPWQDANVWDLIAGGGARAVHHIESPAMIGLSRQCHVREIDGLIAIVSVIRPGAANEGKKRAFTRRYQGLEPVIYPHPSLADCLRSTFGLVVYEEHILQICEAFAGLAPGQADVLRRALGKRQEAVIADLQREFFACARARDHAEAIITEVWDLVRGFAGYAFCKAHSTAYGVEAYQSAWLKRYYPVEFMAAVLANGKGFYHPLVYVLECHRLGIPLRPPTVNQPGPQFTVEGRAIRVPLTRLHGLTARTCERLLAEHGRGDFASLADFHRRVAPGHEEMESLLRVGAFDVFGRSRTAQFWEVQQLGQTSGAAAETGQGWLREVAQTGDDAARVPPGELVEPTRHQRLRWEAELLGFPASGHPLELHPNIAWDTYCPVDRLGEHVGETIVTCGLVVEQRTHHQVTGEPMKFLTLADWTGLVETELFAATYRSYGLAAVRHPVLEVEATVEPFENGHGFSLRVRRAGPPRTR